MYWQNFSYLTHKYTFICVRFGVHNRAKTDSFLCPRFYFMPVETGRMKQKGGKPGNPSKGRKEILKGFQKGEGESCTVREGVRTPVTQVTQSHVMDAGIPFLGLDFMGIY